MKFIKYDNIEDFMKENFELKENNNEIQKQANLKLEQKDAELAELKKQLYESQSLANKYMNIFRKSFFSRLFSGVKKEDIESDTKLLS